MPVVTSEFKAVVPFYVSAPLPEGVPNLQVPMLGIYADEDARIGAGVPDLNEALEANGKNFKFRTYPEAEYAFFNGTGRSYHEDTAGRLWWKPWDGLKTI
jgi:carboxymethylenebutenolidase